MERRYAEMQNENGISGRNKNRSTLVNTAQTSRATMTSSSSRPTMPSSEGRSTLPDEPAGRETMVSSMAEKTKSRGTIASPSPNNRETIPSSPVPDQPNLLHRLDSIQDISQASLLANGGEAMVFRCRYQEQDCVVKVYKQVLPDDDLEEFLENKEKLKNKLNTTLKDYAVPLLKYGFTVNKEGKQEAYYEIMPFLSCGSLEDRLRERTFTLDEIKGTILPQINKIFWEMHAPANRSLQEQQTSSENAIIHCDIKPENIMYAENGTLRLVDFGTARLTQHGRNMKTTMFQGTPEYIAPEVGLANICCPATDYYALGITLYKLFTGHTPREREDDRQAMRGSYVASLSQPDGMPDELFNLICALTRMASYERWTYEKVKRWCEWRPGDPPLVYPSALVPAESAHFDVVFENKHYNSMAYLLFTMASDWEQGKKFLFRQDILQQLRNSQQYKLQSDVQAFLNQCQIQSDSRFYDFLCQFGGKMDYFFWSTGGYDSLGRLGEEMLYFLRENDKAKEASYQEIISNSILCTYLKQKPNCTEKEKELRDQLPSITKEYNRAGARQRKVLAYLFAYHLSEKDHDFNKNGIRYENILAMKKDLAQLADDPKALMEKCLIMQESKGTLDPQFKAWLCYQGMEKEVKGWT